MLKGLSAIVPGGAGGIGSSISRALFEQGASLTILSRRLESVERVNREFGQKNVLSLQCDVTNTESIKESFEMINKYWGAPPSIMVNCAGISKDSLLVSAGDEQIEQQIQTNVVGALKLSRAFVKANLRSPSPDYGASIVFIGSIIGSDGNRGQTVYSACKSSLGGLCSSLAKEYGAKNIRVNVVEPGIISAGMVKDMSSSKYLEEAVKRVPLGRMGEPSDVSNAVLFLTSPSSCYITGQTIRVDGGLHI